MESEQATMTANGMYQYDAPIQTKDGIVTLSSLAHKTHEYNSTSNKWPQIVLKEGCFGFDNMCVCVGFINDKLKNTDEICTVEQIANFIHEAWIINYKFWRDYPPKHPYTQPFKALGDDRRNSLANTPYSKLSDFEKSKDLVIAKFFMDVFGIN